MLAAAARRFPKSGPWGIGLIGFAGALSIYFVLPRIGAIHDQAKLAVGGNEASAAQASFQTVAVIPVVLCFIFGVVWLLERNSRKG